MPGGDFLSTLVTSTKTIPMDPYYEFFFEVNSTFMSLYGLKMNSGSGMKPDVLFNMISDNSELELSISGTNLIVQPHAPSTTQFWANPPISASLRDPFNVRIVHGSKYSGNSGVIGIDDIRPNKSGYITIRSDLTSKSVVTRLTRLSIFQLREQ